MPVGGARPGAGRKKGTSNREKIRELITSTIGEEGIEDIVRSLHYIVSNRPEKADVTGAARLLLEYMYGRPEAQMNAVDERLKTAQANVLDAQITLGLIEAQVKEITSRAEKANIEIKMWPQQFVSEEEEIANLQAIAAAVNQPLMMMTPELFEEITAGKSPSAALEALKGKLARGQADIMAEVMTYKAIAGSNEEEEEEEE